MSDYYGSDDELEAAQNRIDRIRKGGGAAGLPPAEEAAGGFDDVQSDALSRARARARSTRRALGYDEPQATPQRAAVPRATTGSRGTQAILVIGGVVAVGVLVMAALFLVSQFSGAGGGLFSRATDTPTPTFTPTPTETPLPTETPTPTRAAPSNLALPPLTCIFQSGVGCFDYCNNPSNATECQAAKDFVRAQNADPDVWLSCIAPGSGPNVGNPQQCLEDAWRAANP